MCVCVCVCVCVCARARVLWSQLFHVILKQITTFSLLLYKPLP
jgi:hypothetical protein